MINTHHKIQPKYLGFKSTICSVNGKRYKYGFNGKEKDNETYGEGNAYDFGARIYDSRLGRWLSLDPMAIKYPEMSPFIFVGNMPIIAIDPDGKIIKIIVGRNEDETPSEVLTYKGGKLYNENGTVYTGNNAFALKTLKTLNKLSKINDDYVKKVVNTLETSKQEHFIEEAPPEVMSGTMTNEPTGNQKAQAGKPTGSHIIVDYNEKLVLDKVEDSPETNLAHELSHAYDLDQGKNKGHNNDKPTSKSPKEIRAVNFENRVRNALGKKLRKSYNGKQIEKSKLEDPKKPKKND
ncbi:MAG: RHS repeat-associated core domain-containing protein [Bacteroidota bacterium]|nr:RHS repeat-associated core domain-containing protein [Bacteroidota bacterium]